MASLLNRFDDESDIMAGVHVYSFFVVFLLHYKYVELNIYMTGQKKPAPSLLA